ncbi:hypothetical protein Q7P37_006876 [Cladosporium fusiforme]
MQKHIIGFLLTGLLAESAMAVQRCWVRRHNETIMQGGYTGAGELLGCEEVPRLNRRDEEFDTNVEVGDDTVRAILVNADSQDHDYPITFTYLWDRVSSELCTATSCNGDKKVCTPQTNRGGTDICISADGQFAKSDLKDAFIALAREAFDKGLDRFQPNGVNAVYEDGIDWININNLAKDSDNGFLTIRLHHDSSSQFSCSEAAAVINVFAPLLPQFAPIFGIAGAVCAF